MSDSRNCEDITWMMIVLKLPDHKKTRLHCSAASMESHCTAIYELPHTSYDGMVDKLIAKKADHQMIPKEPDEVKTKGYCYDRVDGTGDVVKDYFHEHHNYSSFHELDYRHPGTSEESDDDEWKNQNSVFTAIKTVAGQHIASISFVAPQIVGGSEASDRRCDFYPSYEMQYSMRVDDHRKFLYYDCFEYKPKWWNPDTDEIPTQKEYRRALNSWGGGEN